MIFEGEPLEFEPTLPHQGHALDDEKVLAHGLFQPGADVPPMIHGDTASQTLVSLSPPLDRFNGEGQVTPPQLNYIAARRVPTLDPSRTP